MSLNFDNAGSGEYVGFSPGTIGAVGTGDYTIVGLMMPAGHSEMVSLRSGSLTGTIQREVLADNGGTNTWFGANDFSNGVGSWTANNWYLVGQSKATGTNPYRFHIWPYAADGSGTKTHVNSTSSFGDGSAIAGIQIGNGSSKGNGNIALIAIWKRVLSDADFVALCGNTAAAFMNLSTGAPDALLLCDTTDPLDIVDATGNGANATTVVNGPGTITIGPDAPAFDYSLGTATLSVNTSTTHVIGNTTTTSVTFTPPTNSLVGVFAAGDANDASTNEQLTVASTGHTFTLAERSNGGGGATLELWTCPVTTSTSMTVNVTDNKGAVAKAVKVVWWTDSSGGIPTVGAVTTDNTGNNFASVTATASESWAWFAGFGGHDYTAVTGETLRDHVDAADSFDGGDRMGIYSLDGLSSGAGQNLFVTADPGSTNHVILTEIVPPPPAPSGVTVDAVGPTSAGTDSLSSPLSWTHTASGTNRAVVVGVSEEAVGTGTVTVTYGGVAMTELGRQKSNNGNNGMSLLFGLLNPATGPQTVVVTGDNKQIGGSVSFNGVDQTTPFDTAVTAFGTGTNPSISVSSATDDMVVDVVVNGQAITSDTGGSLQWKDNVITSFAAGNAAQSTYTGASNVTAGYTTTHDDWGIVAVNIRAVGSIDNGGGIAAWFRA